MMRTAGRRSRGVAWLGLVVAGAILTGVGAALTWISVESLKIGLASEDPSGTWPIKIPSSAGGLAFTEGKVTLALGIVLLMLALIGITRRGGRGIWIALAVLSVAVIVVTAYFLGTSQLVALQEFARQPPPRKSIPMIGLIGLMMQDDSGNGGMVTFTLVQGFAPGAWVALLGGILCFLGALGRLTTAQLRIGATESEQWK